MCTESQASAACATILEKMYKGGIKSVISVQHRSKYAVGAGAIMSYIRRAKSFIQHCAALALRIAHCALNI